MSIEKPNIESWGAPTYSLTSDMAVNLRISAILNEALHVFEWHKEGIWQSTYKEGFAALLAKDIESRPSLMRKILKLNNRIFSMVAYRAAEMLKEEKRSK